MLTNKGELAKSIADRFLDGGKSLADDQDFQSARKSIQGTPTLWGYANAELIRDNKAAKQLLREKHDNPAAELLLGGVLSDLQKAPFVTASLFFEKDRLAFNLSMPHDLAWIPERREFFFGADGKQGAPAPLRPKQTVLSIEAHRDVGAWWLGKEDLYEEQVVAKLELADSQFSNLFAGLDFGQEVLGALKPGAQIVLTRQDFDKLEGPKPDIQLPAGAFVFNLKEPEKIWRRLKVSYQSALGLINFQLGQQGQPQLEMETQKIDKAQIISASYLPDEGKDGAINYNFSPSIAFVRGRFIVASTRELVRELVDLVNQQKNVDARTADNTHARLDLKVLQQILQDNRQQLVTQIALQQGKEKAAAEKEVGIGLDLLSATQDLTIRLAAEKNILRFDIELKFAGANDK